MRLLPLLALLAACAAPTPPPAEVPLPPGPVSAGDPGRGAVLSAAWAFGAPQRLAGHPADSARAVARLEWMAATLPTDQGWIAARATLFPALREAAAAERMALGLDPAAPPAAVAGALIAAAAALEAGEGRRAEAALAPVAPGGGGVVLARLDPLPALRIVADATALAQAEMGRIMQEDPGF